MWITEPPPSDILAKLLREEGYSTKVLEKPSASAANAEEQLVGVDLLLLLTPSLRGETREGLLEAIEAAPAAAAGVPVLTLSTAPRTSRMIGRAWCPGKHSLRISGG